MEAVVEHIPVYVVKMTRLEAARNLVDPRELQSQLRALLDPDGNGAEPRVIEGKGIPLALPSGQERQPKRRKHRKLKAAKRQRGEKVQCPYCERRIADFRMNTHIAAKHPGVSTDD